MADPRFFDRAGPFTLKHLAEISQSVLRLPDDSDYKVDDVATLSDAGASHISFMDNVKYRDQLVLTKAGAIVLGVEMVPYAPQRARLLISKSPYKSYAYIAQAFYPVKAPDGIISEKAYIHPTAKIHATVSVQAGAFIDEGVVIGEGAFIASNVSIAKNVSIGAHTIIGANASLSHCMIGDWVNIYPGVRIGQDGFGFAIDPAGHVKVPQLGRVIIEDHVEIGANTTIDRGAGPDTVIGQGTWIDNLVQIGHNVRIGKGCVIIAQAGIAGSTILEDYAVIAAQVGVAGHLRIGMGARIGAKAGVMRDVPPGEEQLGAPAVPAKEFMRQVATLKRLTKGQKSE